MSYTANCASSSLLSNYPGTLILSLTRTMKQLLLALMQVVTDSESNTSDQTVQHTSGNDFLLLIVF